MTVIITRVWVLFDFRGQIAPGGRVVLVTTACYSGGAIHPDLNYTTLTAAGPLNESIAWLPSASIGEHMVRYLPALLSRGCPASLAPFSTIQPVKISHLKFHQMAINDRVDKPES